MTAAGEAAPDVSVVIPVYNGGDYLAASMATITGQTLTDIEIIVVNDGSTDGSGAVLDALAATDRRVRVVHQANGGIVKALNAGLALARGRYIARMDGDDLAWPERLERQRDFLDANPDHVAIGTLYRTIDGEGRVMHVQRPTDQNRQTDIIHFPPIVKSVPHPTLMARGDAMRALGYRSWFPHAEDQDLFIRLAPLGRVAVIPDLLLDYRVHANATSARNRTVQIDSVLKAQCGAMIQAHHGVDIFAGGDVPTLAAMLAGYPDLPSPASWETLRAMYDVDNNLDRRDLRGARRSLVQLARRLALHQRSLRKDGSWGMLCRRGVKAGARFAHMSVRPA